MSEAIRLANSEDLEEILEIYNYEVRTGFNAFDLEERSVDEHLEWYKKHDSNYPILVAEVDKEILGWGALSPWAPHGGYYGTVEHSVFIKREAQGRGLGKRLVLELIEAAKKNNYHTMIARITAGNEPSIKLHEKLGFTECGYMKEVGQKFGKLLDVHILQKILNKD